ncbi:hypothetical protein Taro_044738 [Colocasia esculenta]|uniref:Uncharacterized protein n=1 Tax=Colocasia esculenta TaxID=4460 RepID=A0A843WYV8_COLES|nr:hypothetical protein [Colocasia esculenta]
MDMEEEFSSKSPNSHQQVVVGEHRTSEVESYNQFCSARGGCCGIFTGQFDYFEVCLACSRLGDLARSGGNTGIASFFAFFTKVKESKRFPYRLPVQSRVAAVLGRRLQQCRFSSVVPRGMPQACVFSFDFC